MTVDLGHLQNQLYIIVQARDSTAYMNPNRCRVCVCVCPVLEGFNVVEHQTHTTESPDNNKLAHYLQHGYSVYCIVMYVSRGNRIRYARHYGRALS